MPVTDFDVKEKYRYQNGFGCHFESEAVDGALPIGHISPQRPPYGLYAEKLSGTAFTAPRHDNKQTWLYRILPSCAHPPYRPAVLGDALDAVAAPGPEKVHYIPNQLRWDPFDHDEAHHLDFVSGLHLVAGAGDAALKQGLGMLVYACGRSMGPDRAFYSADGDLLIVPQEGALDIRTELGWLLVRPMEVAVIPRGVKYSVALVDDKPARGYALELYQGHFQLPELGPIGSNGLANARDFQAPVACFSDVAGETASMPPPPPPAPSSDADSGYGLGHDQTGGENNISNEEEENVQASTTEHAHGDDDDDHLEGNNVNGHANGHGPAHDTPREFIITCKFNGNLFETRQPHTPFDVVAWQGNYYPYKYDLGRFNTIGTISFDHPDPSIFTVLSAPSPVAGTAVADFVVFPPRWLVGEDTFRPPWYHRNTMSEFMGLIAGAYDAKKAGAGGFVPGGASLHNVMSGHGPDSESCEAARDAPLQPVKVGHGSCAFMFESCLMLGVSEWGLRRCRKVQHGYSEESWGCVRNHWQMPKGKRVRSHFVE